VTLAGESPTSAADSHSTRDKIGCSWRRDATIRILAANSV
jgi:hypothetical protein